MIPSSFFDRSETEPIPEAPRVTCPWCQKEFTVDEVIEEVRHSFDERVGYFYAEGDPDYYLLCLYCEDRFHISRIRGKFEVVDGWGELNVR